MKESEQFSPRRKWTVQNKVANIISSLVCSKMVIRSDQNPAMRSVERNVVESLFDDAVRQLCGCQVVMPHSPVGESAANGVIEDAIQRVQGQVRTIKLDLETNIKAKLNSSQTIWPWLIEYAETFLVLENIRGRRPHDDPEDHGGRPTTAPRPSFGERIVYKMPKVVKLSEPEGQMEVWSVD